jgi:hypothetical protein
MMTLAADADSERVHLELDGFGEPSLPLVGAIEPASSKLQRANHVQQIRGADSKLRCSLKRKPARSLECEFGQRIKLKPTGLNIVVECFQTSPDLLIGVLSSEATQMEGIDNFQCSKVRQDQCF